MALVCGIFGRATISKSMTLPDLPIIDAHQHFWDLEANYLPWLRDEPPIPFRYGDYRVISGCVTVIASPFSICSRNIGTTEPAEPSTLPNLTAVNFVA